jgi:hypothetical protein
MDEVTTQELACACRIFMTLAYPAGVGSIPAKKRAYFDLPADRPVSEFLPPAAVAAEICQAIPAPGGGLRGWAFRLGSAHFPHLKLKVQQVDFDNRTVWVFMVDTHDTYSKSSSKAPPGSPDAAAWTQLQDANRQLKEAIERALEAAGLVTFNSLLRGDLKTS